MSYFHVKPLLLVNPVKIEMVKLDTQENPFWLLGILLIQKMTAQGVKEVNVMPKSNKITGGGQQMSM